MAIADQQGTTITTGDKVALAWQDGNKPVLVIGVLTGALQNDRGVDYFAVVRSDARFNRDIARAEVSYTTAYPNGVVLNAVKAGFS